jgi:hypothetical protein
MAVSHNAAVVATKSCVSNKPRTRAFIFLLFVVLFWRHNQFAYKRRYSQWERSFLSFLCQRCGTLTEQE